MDVASDTKGTMEDVDEWKKTRDETTWMLTAREHRPQARRSGAEVDAVKKCAWKTRPTSIETVNRKQERTRQRLTQYRDASPTTDNAGGNKAAAAGPVKNAVKLENETEDFHHDRVSFDLKKAIMQARLDKKMTQAQLAQMINEKPQVIQEYESGKAIPNQQVLGKIERALGAKLRGKKTKK